MLVKVFHAINLEACSLTQTFSNELYFSFAYFVIRKLCSSDFDLCYITFKLFALRHHDIAYRLTFFLNTAVIFGTI